MEAVPIFEAKFSFSDVLARRDLIARCRAASKAAPIEDFDVRAAIEDGRD